MSADTFQRGHKSNATEGDGGGSVSSSSPCVSPHYAVGSTQSSGRGATKIQVVQTMPGTLQRFHALIIKRLLVLWRTPFLFVTGWILPIVIASFVIEIIDRYHIEELPEASYTNLSTVFSERETSARTLIQEATAVKDAVRYKALLESEDIPYDVTTDVLKTLRTKYDENYFDYVFTYAFGSVFKEKV
ncbi:hypothetical protein MTO96_007833 [Rhipicephalus appendiculatus]